MYSSNFCQDGLASRVAGWPLFIGNCSQNKPEAAEFGGTVIGCGSLSPIRHPSSVLWLITPKKLCVLLLSWYPKQMSAKSYKYMCPKHESAWITQLRCFPQSCRNCTLSGRFFSSSYCILFSRVPPHGRVGWCLACVFPPHACLLVCSVWGSWSGLSGSVCHLRLAPRLNYCVVPDGVRTFSEQNYNKEQSCLTSTM